MENKIKTFDCIIMNPPYERNLHLKILAEAIKHLNDEKSVCVNLSPIRWLQDPLAKYKKNSDYRKFEQSISKHIEDMLIIEAVNVQSIFMNANIGARLGVYKLRKQTTTFDYEKLSHNAIVSKSIEYIITNNPNLEMNKQYGWRVRMPLILSGKANGSGVRKPTLSSFGALKYFNDGKYSDGRWWHECYQKNQHSKSTPYITLSIEFENENKCKNFISQFNSSFARYITDLLLGDVNISPEKVLWMENAINPRTGLKGYDSEWIDEDFCKYFNITGFISDSEAEPNSEWETILKTIEKFK